ncbi:SAC3 family protein B isoform X2 [Castanea sativa]|uniref:SAC3 family protein B isoform X2 n=1 Tax=Castanea sativa TaxID=21020 RepID=UPI003F650FBC
MMQQLEEEEERRKRYPGFTKASGPSGPPQSPSLSLLPNASTSAPLLRSPTPRPRGPGASLGVQRSPPLAFERAGPAVRPTYQNSSGIRRVPEAAESRPLAFESTRFAANPPHSSAGVHRLMESPPSWGDRQRSLSKDYEAQIHQRSSASLVASRNYGTNVTARVARSQNPERTKSPPSLHPNSDIAGYSSQPVHGRPDSFSTPLDNRPRSPVNYADLLDHQDQPSVSPYLGSDASARSFTTDTGGVQVLKRTRSPPLQSGSDVLQDNLHFAQSGSKRSASFSSPLDNRPRSPVNYADLLDHQDQPSVSPYLGSDASARSFTTDTGGVQVLKRTRSPPLQSGSDVLQDNLHFAESGSKREMQAKAKRLARFKVELNANVQGSPDFADQKANKHEQSMVERQKYVGNHPPELAGDFTNGHVSSDYDASESSTIITGSCPDMCPESERAERERKGDLDQFERLDGDRNQTSKSLAVKKYTRTAEREAGLIRPMPILQKTIDYLLNLLDQPYDDKFLGIYNFLWDRMRAIRMDLRMQHIFNQGAIVMLEQMIRLHIIAMHELCEHTKGEGFSEGFDAHLNIEQMNKTSVELFQLYDDHRKRGINVPTEKEFRGYYALLKLDKHPGYKVEPAELSLDLAKMTPEIRQTPEVLFARDVARACRTVNFIAFFRLARRASYLQACLIHAHFAKLRTQALASLHSGLQNNQGLPVTHVAKWLAMEDEDIESLLQYHGFSIKVFEEPYMMKEGPFLNLDKDYPTKCSELVHIKRSKMVVEDVSPSTQVVSSPAKATEEIKFSKIHKHDMISTPYVEKESSTHRIDEEMSDLDAILSPKDSRQPQPIVITPTVSKQGENDRQAADSSISPWGFLLSHSSPRPELAKVGIVGKPNSDALSRSSTERNMRCDIGGMPLQMVSTTVLQERASGGKYDYAVENSGSLSVVFNNLEDAEATDIHADIHEENEISKVVTDDYDEETAEAKLKLILRLWKRRAIKRREVREQRQLAANTALDLLSLGPPIRQNKDQPSNIGEFNIDHVMWERYKRHVESWSRLNVSDVIAGILSRRNPDAKCLCWKVIVCSLINNSGGVKLEQRNQVACLPAGSWLLSKLMPFSKGDDDDLVISSPGLSIWRKWASQYDADPTCCLSIVKDTDFDNLDETVAGASAVLFLVSDNIPWNHQKVQLQKLLMSIPSGSCLPLLILSGSCKEETPDSFSIMVNELGLHEIDKSQISSFQVFPLVVNDEMEHSDGFFSDEQLREGLKWLASESPLQPVLHNMKTRELVLPHLNSSLEVLERINDFEVSPNSCISAFNKALDWSLEEIASAAKANPANWPCPEIALLAESSDEHRVVKWYLPTIGWNSLEKIEPLMFALRDCKLPAFTDDISWLARGSHMGKEIKNQRLQLENCLVTYLTSSKMMRYTEAMKEASLMLQKSAHLELHNSCYCIVPKWVMIFRRIFNWRLMNLSSGSFSVAYVLERHHVAPPITGDVDMLGLEDSVPSHYLNHPSLDEIIEGCCTLPPLLGGDESQPEAFQPLSRMVPNGEVHEATTNTNDLVEDERDVVQDGNLDITYKMSYTNVFDSTRTEIVVAGKATQEAENLSKLLEQCNIQQNKLDETLSIYF